LRLLVWGLWKRLHLEILLQRCKTNSLKCVTLTEHASTYTHMCKHTQPCMPTHTHKYISTTSFKTSSSTIYTTAHTPNPPWTVTMFISCSVLYSWKLLHQGSSS
jgi:hypothetical protein